MQPPPSPPVSSSRAQQRNYLSENPVVGLVMEQAVGSVRDSIRQEAQPPTLLRLKWLAEAAQGLTYLHMGGTSPVVHGAVHPGNMLVAADGRVLVSAVLAARRQTTSFSPFSVAPSCAPLQMSEYGMPFFRSAATAACMMPGRAPDDSGTTPRDLLMTTLPYVPPEVMMSGWSVATPASDVYSFAMATWEVLTGEKCQRGGGGGGRERA
jgi:serine/threonine protein kinase